MENIAISSRPNSNESIPSAVLGMSIFLFTELMFFTGLISAYIVERAGVENWPPIGQPRLPIGVTAVNTLFLLTSGVTMFLFIKRYSKGEKAKFLLYTTLTFGSLFLIVQGFEWVEMLNYGLGVTSGLYGSFFYGIIGMHGFHVLVGVLILFYLNSIFSENGYEATKGKVLASSMYWYFVVGIWPMIYYLVYLF